MIFKKITQLAINSSQSRIRFLQVCFHIGGCKERLTLKTTSWLSTSSERGVSHSNQTTLNYEFIKFDSNVWQNLDSCHQYYWVVTTWHELKWLIWINPHFPFWKEEADKGINNLFPVPGRWFTKHHLTGLRLKHNNNI